MNDENQDKTPALPSSSAPEMPAEKRSRKKKIPDPAPPASDSYVEIDVGANGSNGYGRVSTRKRTRSRKAVYKRTWVPVEVIDREPETRAAAASKIHFDRLKAFLSFLRCGNLNKVAADLQVPLQSLILVADAEDWAGQMESLRRGPANAQNQERCANRGLSFVVANRLRALLDIMLADILGRIDRGEASPLSMFTETSKDGMTKMNSKLFSDVARALTAADAVTSKALGDSVTERIKGKPEDDVDPANASLSVLTALSNLAVAPAARIVSSTPDPDDYSEDEGL